MMMAAENIGLGTLWVLRFDPAKVSEQFSLPEHIIPISMLAVGYPTRDATRSAGHGQRFSKDRMLLIG
jgi:nitroreductase